MNNCICGYGTKISKFITKVEFLNDKKIDYDILITQLQQANLDNIEELLSNIDINNLLNNTSYKKLSNEKKQIIKNK